MPEFAFPLMDTVNQEASIKVIGIGGGGGNAVSHMVTKGIQGVEFICANTDTQDLRNTKAETQLQIGINETQGLGSGSKPEIGRASAEEDRERIASVIDGANMLFIAAGLGGGTGTGASPVVAEIAQEKGILTVAVVNTPFTWEGEKRKVGFTDNYLRVRNYQVSNNKLDFRINNSNEIENSRVIKFVDGELYVQKEKK